MDNERRIAELEARVRELTELVRQLAEVDEEEHQEASSEEDTEQHHGFAVREQVDRILRRTGGEEQLEARVGTVWLSRLAVLTTMTAVALGARYTFNAEALGPWQIGPSEKALLGLFISALFIGYGLFFRKAQEVFAEAILGCGLASLYFTTYAVFNVDQMRLVDDPRMGLIPLALCIGFIGGLSHYCRSQTVAGIGIFLAYYTVVVSATQAPTLSNLIYALGTCTALALLSLLFHAAHRWILLSWATLIATQVTYVLFFLREPKGLELSAEAYFWISNGFLALCYVVFSLTAILDAHKTGEYRRGVASMAGVNSFVFFVLTWLSIREVYLEEEWLFRSAFAVLLLIFAGLCALRAPRRNYLYQIFLAKAIVMFTLALQAYFPGEKLMVAMAVECLGLAFSYRRSGIVMFKVLGMGLMGVTTIACLFSYVVTISAPEAATTTALGPVAVPSTWFSAVGVAFFFCITAWFYENFVRRLAPEERTVKGQWFLADSPLDLPTPSIAIVHASAAALVLLTLTIIDFSDHPMLPWLLAGEGVVLALLGLLLRTPQIEIGSVLLIAVAHVVFHAFLWMPLEGFEAQPRFAEFTAALAFFTYIGASAWERYLRRYQPGVEDLEHHVFAALPYLAATFMLTTLITLRVDAIFAPAALGVLGMALLFLGLAFGLNAIKASGVFAAGIGVARFYLSLYNAEAPLAKSEMFLPYFLLFLLTLVGAERLFILLQQQERVPSAIESYLRTALVVVVGVLGVLGFYEWSPPHQVMLYLIGLAIVTIVLGALFRESRYRWCAIGLFGLSLLLAFIQFPKLPPLYQFLTFAAAAAALLVVSWAYALSRRRHPPSAADGQS
jgi:hypothetical protein